MPAPLFPAAVPAAFPRPNTAPSPAPPAVMAASFDLGRDASVFSCMPLPPFTATGASVLSLTRFALSVLSFGPSVLATGARLGSDAFSYV